MVVRLYGPLGSLFKGEWRQPLGIGMQLDEVPLLSGAGGATYAVTLLLIC